MPPTGGSHSLQRESFWPRQSGGISYTGLVFFDTWVLHLLSYVDALFLIEVFGPCPQHY